MGNIPNLLRRGLAFIWVALAHVRFAMASQFSAKSRERIIAYSMEPRRLTMAEQWACLVDIIKTAVARADEASRCQAAAALQLDLAQYALMTLVDELAGVMDMQGRRRRSNVHVLEIAPQHAMDDAIAA